MALPTEQKDPEDKGRKSKEVSKDLQNANFDESPPEPAKPKKPGEEQELGPDGKPKPTVPEPGPKTPADMANSPDAYLPEDEVTSPGGGSPAKP